MNEFTEFLKHAKTCQDALDKEVERLDNRDATSWEEAVDRFKEWVVPIQQALEQIDFNCIKFIRQWYDGGLVSFEAEEDERIGKHATLIMSDRSHPHRGDYHSTIKVYSDSYCITHGFNGDDATKTKELNTIMDRGIEYYLNVIKKGVESALKMECFDIERRGGQA